MRWALLLPAALAACDAPGASSAATPGGDDQYAAFVRAMKAMDLQYENLRADLAAARPAEDARRRLAAIRAGAGQASRLPYRASEAENRDLAFEFARFLESTAALEGASWAGDPGMAAWKRLGSACATCHDLYREEK